MVSDIRSYGDHESLTFRDPDGNELMICHFPEKGDRMIVTIVEKPEMKAAVLRIPRDGHRVRQAWKEVSERLAGHPAIADRENGLVFIPEWQWPTEVTNLWVGVEVTSFDSLPEGLEHMTILPRKFAKISVKGDRDEMWKTYNALGDWFNAGPYERDMSEGSFGFEKNPLQPVNPFEIPADEISFFEFDIYAPIKETDGKTGETGVISAEIKAGRPRKLVGFELFVDQQKTPPTEALPKFWEQIRHRMGEIPHRVSPNEFIGVFQYAPPFGPGQDFRYLAAVEVDPDHPALLPEEAQTRTIPGNETMVVTYRGNLKEVGQVWNFIHGNWRSGQTEYEIIDDYEFERFDHRFLGADNENSVMEIHFPVRKRNSGM